MESSLNEHRTHRRCIRSTYTHNLVDLEIAHHLPQTIGAEKQHITHPRWYSEAIDFYRWLVTECTQDLIALRMGIHLIIGNRSNLHKASDDRMVLGDPV